VSASSRRAHTAADWPPSFRSSTTSAYVNPEFPQTQRTSGHEDKGIGLTHPSQALVEGPSSDSSKRVPRHAAPLSHISLTNVVIPKVPLAIGHTGLKKMWEAEKVEDKWSGSKAAKMTARYARRKQLTDFERFKVMVLRKQARFEVRKSQASARASAKA